LHQGSAGVKPLSMVASPRRAIDHLAGNLRRRFAWEVRAFGIKYRLLRYRPDRWSVEMWEHAYSEGTFDFMRNLYELPRYSVLIGYVRTLAAAPAILDIGCGVGILREMLDSTDFTSYVGVDVSAEAIKSASRLADKRTRFTVGDATTIDLPRADVIVLNEIIYYAPSPHALLERVASVARPGGLVLTSIWRHPGDETLWRLLDREFRLVAACQIGAEMNPYNRRGWRVSCHAASPSVP